ncbi:MAG: hypothetical protein HYW77_01725 [Parcubacteria group bacterium]|nr:hypothetical protein [Parcubacteria group bacterium]
MKDNTERPKRKKKCKLIEIRIFYTGENQETGECIEKEKSKFLKRSRRVKKYLNIMLDKIEECLPHDVASKTKIVEATKENIDYLIVVGPQKRFEIIFEIEKCSQAM